MPVIAKCPGGPRLRLLLPLGGYRVSGSASGGHSRAHLSSHPRKQMETGKKKRMEKKNNQTFLFLLPSQKRQTFN